MPSDSLQTLGMNYGDTLVVNGVPYVINDTRNGEGDILRLLLMLKIHLIWKTVMSCRTAV